jgi:hypothetical protein
MRGMTRVDDGYAQCRPLAIRPVVFPPQLKGMNAHASAATPAIRAFRAWRRRRTAHIVSIVALAVTSSGTAYEAVALRQDGGPSPQVHKVGVLIPRGSSPGSQRLDGAEAADAPRYAVRFWTSKSQCVGPPACG